MHHDLTRTLGVLLTAAIAAGCQKQPAEEPQTKDQPATSQSSSIGPTLDGPTLDDREVEAACGQCKFSLEGGGCDLAVRFDGQAYYVDGTTIDEHGDAHGVDGFCTVIRKAIVSGNVEDGRFVVTTFKVLPSGG